WSPSSRRCCSGRWNGGTAPVGRVTYLIRWLISTRPSDCWDSLLWSISIMGCREPWSFSGMVELNALKDRVTRRDYGIGIVGAGYVGLPLALTFAEAGFPVTAFDVDPAKVRRLNAGSTYIRSISDERIGNLVRQGRLVATDDMSGLGKPD